MTTFTITRGRAIFKDEGLRCHAPRPEKASRADKPCNKLIVKFSASRQIAGNFRCERCGQEIEVEQTIR